MFRSRNVVMRLAVCGTGSQPRLGVVVEIPLELRKEMKLPVVLLQPLAVGCVNVFGLGGGERGRIRGSPLPSQLVRRSRRDPWDCELSHVRVRKLEFLTETDRVTNDVVNFVTLVVKHSDSTKSAKQVGDIARHLDGLTNARYLTELPDSILKEIGKVAEEIAGDGPAASKIKEAIQNMGHHRVDIRLKGTEDLFDIIRGRLLKPGEVWSEDAIVAASKVYGPEVLLFMPEFANSYRAHKDFYARLGQKGADSFEAFLEGMTNKSLQRNALSFLDDSLDLAKRILAKGDTILRAGARTAASSHAQRKAVLRSFKEIIDEVGEVAFFEVLFSKSRYLVSDPLVRDRVRRELMELISLPQDYPKLVKQGKVGNQLIRADHTLIKGMAGEALALKNSLATAKAAAKKADEPVYVLLGNRLDSIRNRLDDADQEIFDALPTRLTDPEIDVRDFEKSAEVKEVLSKSKETTDAVVAKFDKKGGLEAIERGEVKVAKDGPQAGAKQHAHHGNEMVGMTGFEASTVIQVMPDGTVKHLSLDEAAELSKGTKRTSPDKLDLDGNPEEALYFGEGDKVREKLDKLEEQLLNGDIDEKAFFAREAALEGERKLKFKGSDRKVLVGDDQAKRVGGKLDGFEVKGFGHNYDTVHELLHDLLFLTSLSR